MDRKCYDRRWFKCQCFGDLVHWKDFTLVTFDVKVIHAHTHRTLFCGLSEENAEKMKLSISDISTKKIVLLSALRLICYLPSGNCFS